MTIAKVGPLGIRPHHIEKKCVENVGHKHNYDHTTMVIRGRVKVTFRDDMPDGTVKDIESREYHQGEAFVCLANRYHTIKALEDDTVYNCIFSHRDFDGLVTQTFVGNVRAYD